MTFSEVNSRYNGPALEEEILEFWDRESIFDKSLEQSEGRPRFSFNEGPPTANGKPGIHHVLARTFKDIYPRYKTMRGYYAPRKGGWDTHGLPVEHEIEKKLGIFDKKEIEKQVGIAEFTRQLSRVGDDLYRRLGGHDPAHGLLGQPRRSLLHVGQSTIIESVWNLLKQIWDKGLIYQGNKVVPYDPRIGATLSSHEVAQGYKEVEDPSITVRFPAGRRGGYLLPGLDHDALDPAVQPAAGGGGRYRLCLRRVRRPGPDRWHRRGWRRCSATLTTRSRIRVKGRDLVGTRYQRLFDFLEVSTGDPFRVVSADFVSTEDGTGIVHTAPAYGVDDLALGQQEGLPVVHGVGLDGYFKAEVEPVAGKFFKEADPVICSLLEERGLMFRNEKPCTTIPSAGAPATR